MDLGGGAAAKFHLFQNTDMFHIKSKEMTHVVTCQQIFCLLTPLDPGGWVKRSNFNFV